MSSGGGGQSGQTRYDWNDVIGGYWGGRPGPDGRGNGVLGWAADIAMGPKDDPRGGYRPWGQSQNADGSLMDYNDPRNTGARRIADFNTDQRIGFQRTRDMASSGGPAETQTGRSAAQIAAAGGLYNQFAGDNPYFRQSLQSGLEDITSAYKNGTSADTTRLFNMSGAFGSSAHQTAVANNENALARNLSRTANEAYQQQYDRSANLDEQRLGRQMSAIPLTYQAQGLSTDLNDRLLGIGQTQQGQRDREIQDDYSRWAEGQNWSRNNVSWLAQLLGGAQGSTGISTQFAGYQPANYGSMALGAGLLGSGLFGGR